MPVETSIANLSQTAASNSPPGTESPTTIDDYHRQALAFVAQHRDGKGFSAEADIASAATCDIGAANTFFLRVTGTTTITSFGTPSLPGPRFLRFAAALTLTHNASSLILPGAANITTAAGDACVVVPLAAGWQVVAYQPAALFVGPTASAGRTALGFTAPVIDRAYAEYTANADLTVSIPADDTIPQNTEGTQIISLSFTPKSTTNRLRLRFRGEVALAAAGSAGAAIFSSASANALRAGYVYLGNLNSPGELVLEHEFVPATTSALAFTVRVGPLGSGTARMNGTTAGRVFGGAMAATLVIEEIAA